VRGGNVRAASGLFIWRFWTEADYSQQFTARTTPLAQRILDILDDVSGKFLRRGCRRDSLKKQKKYLYWTNIPNVSAKTR
jgi:hypothetical protein